MNGKTIFSLFLIIGLILPGMVETPILQPTIKPIGENAWVITGNYFNEHMTVVETSIGLVIVDTLTHVHATTRAMKLVRQFTVKPVKYVINTHFDVDHYGGNQLFPEAAIIGHINCKNHYDFCFLDKPSNRKEIDDLLTSLKSIIPGDDRTSILRRETYHKWYTHLAEGFSGFKFTPPTLFIKESKTIHCGKTEIRLLHFGPGHTDADLVVYFPEEKILAAGDLVLGEKTIPVIHRIHGGNILNMISILDQIEKMAATASTLVPGHGTYTGIGVIHDQKQYLTRLIEAVKKAQREGLGLKSTQEKIKMAPYKNHWLFEFIHQGNIETAWHQLKSSDLVER